MGGWRRGGAERRVGDEAEADNEAEVHFDNPPVGSPVSGDVGRQPACW